MCVYNVFCNAYISSYFLPQLILSIANPTLKFFTIFITPTLVSIVPNLTNNILKYADKLISCLRSFCNRKFKEDLQQHGTYKIFQHTLTNQDINLNNQPENDVNSKETAVINKLYQEKKKITRSQDRGYRLGVDQETNRRSLKNALKEFSMFGRYNDSGEIVRFKSPYIEDFLREIDKPSSYSPPG